jgi:hypothetical protein
LQEAKDNTVYAFDKHGVAEETLSENSKSYDGDHAEKVKEKFDSGDHKQSFDGWDLYKKTKISMAPVRRYIAHVDADYKHNKVTVCANLSNIYNTFIVRHGRPGPHLNNFFDIEKWASKFGPLNDEVKQGFEKSLKRDNTIALIQEEKGLGKQDSVA